MISVDGLAKKFGSAYALKDISFEAKQGEIVGFLGPNGAGKTTTMRLILGYLSPTGGSVRVNGIDPAKNRMGVLKNAGYLPENNPLYPDMKVGEYLSFIAAVKKETDLASIVASVSLEEKTNVKIEELSRGYRQRVGLAASLCGNPDILILDEPTSGLDPIEQEAIRRLIKKLSRRKTIIFSTHILSEVEEIADKVVIINRGAVVYQGSKPKEKGGVAKLFRQKVKD
jgi:ABC-2 type transport system ATP-binding protein